MINFEATASYKLIYIYTIWNKAHEGLLKIGETSIASSKTYKQLQPDCADLNLAARKRIDQQTKTSGTSYQLLYTELAVFEKKDSDGSIIPMPISTKADKKVHNILKSSGIMQVCPDGIAADEWFMVDLATAKNAIRAMKEGRITLTSNEVTREDPPIIFRTEQIDAIEKTKERFKRSSKMLWNAKMRYGKTVTTLELIRQMKFKKVIIVTHRPVVESGWRDDFYKIFKGKDACYTFLGKEKNFTGENFDEATEAKQDSQLITLVNKKLPFIYFASIQDLRGSKRVGGKYDKNNAVFDMDWDLLVEDEAHEGTQTELGKDVIKSLIKKNTKALSLSGTPFNIIDQYDEDGIYTWDYVMEQYEKEHWDEEHPNEDNPYEALPKMHIYTYDLGNLINGYDDYALEGKAFNFREFFRTWSGKIEQDGKDLPSNASVGDFIHGDDVYSFLNLITKEDESSNYPFSNDEYRSMFKHTLWILPGVKEAKALSNMLKNHPIFKDFAIANVAGDGDEEENYYDALEEVRSKIKNNDYTITLSCGKLTTGVTVKEWTAVFILSGSYSISAAGYLQTIFRAQSPGSIDGRKKEHCYVFDFAPDRSLRVFAEAARASRAGGGVNQDNTDEVLKQFLNFCPIISVSGTQMKAYDVASMLGQIRRIQVEKAIRSGFDDNSIYNDELTKLDKLSIKDFEDLKKIVGSHQAQKSLNNVVIAKEGFTEAEYKELQKTKRKKPNDLTTKDKNLLEKEKEQRKQKKSAISILRAISIRMPLLIYGADVPFEKDITLEDFVEIVDKESWDEFMPQGVSKSLFKKFMKYYDTNIFVSAGREIRRLAKDADKLSPTERIKKIATIFSFFKNPDKETVLTPWRVVNMHMSSCLGGWCFYNDNFEEDTFAEQKKLLQPRFVDLGEVTAKTLGNTSSKILEINSKSGLYPLYIAYSLYKARLGLIPEEDITPQAQQRYWIDAVKNGVYVICKTPMAKAITKRTLVGYSDIDVNAQCYKNLVNTLKSEPEKFLRKAVSSSWWKKEGVNMRFDAIVGNPPYQEMDGGNGVSAAPTFQYFVEQGKKLNPNYMSMIIPARWYAGGKGLDEFRTSMLNDSRLEKLIDFETSKDCFPSVSIAGGLCYFLWNAKHDGECEVTNIVNGKKTSIANRKLNEHEVFVRSNYSVAILNKVIKLETNFLTEGMYARNAFGFPTNYRGRPEKVTGDVELLTSKGFQYIKREEVTKNKDIIDAYKILIGRLVPSNGELDLKPGDKYKVITDTQLIGPNQINTETYLDIGVFFTEQEAQNFEKYIHCKFTRFLLKQAISSVNVTRECFMFVPKLDFKKEWDDESLYKKYKLSVDEIDFIENSIRPM